MSKFFNEQKKLDKTFTNFLPLNPWAVFQGRKVQEDSFKNTFSLRAICNTIKLFIKTMKFDRSFRVFHFDMKFLSYYKMNKLGKSQGNTSWINPEWWNEIKYDSVWKYRMCLLLSITPNLDFLGKVLKRLIVGLFMAYFIAPTMQYVVLFFQL